MFASIESLLSKDERNAYTMTPFEISEFVKCAQDIVYFCETYIMIQNNDEGLIPWKPWDFQKKFLLEMATDENIITKFPRQCGKSTTTRGYLIWYSIFNRDKNVAILANKEDLAIEQLDQLKQSYCLLPEFLQVGCMEYNKKNIKLGNNTRIIARATSENGVRGRAINKIYLDEFAFVAENIASPFIRSVFPTVASGKNSSIIITSTPKGRNHFYELWNKALDGKGTFRTMEIPWDAVPGRDEEWAKARIEDIGEIAFNQEFRCTFLGSDETLINSEYLAKLDKQLKTVFPMDIKGLPEGIRIFKKPLSLDTLESKEWHYVASLDSGMGMKSDSSVLQIALVKNNRNIHQVACYSRNDLNIRDFIDNCMPLLKSYHNPRLIVEANGIGEGALVTLNNVMMYEDLVHFDTRGLRMGLVPTATNKFNAVILLKAYIEKNLLKIFDNKTITELSNFGRVGNISSRKYGGKNGGHDDHVMSLLWIPYYCNSSQYWGNVDYDPETCETGSLLDIPNDSSIIGSISTAEATSILDRAGNSSMVNMDDDYKVSSPLISEYELYESSDAIDTYSDLDL